MRCTHAAHHRTLLGITQARQNAAIKSRLRLHDTTPPGSPSTREVEGDGALKL